jgi:hypothetical protein
MIFAPVRGSRADVSRIRDFTDLLAWKAARILRANVYKLSKSFPKQECLL